VTTRPDRSEAAAAAATEAYHPAPYVMPPDLLRVYTSPAGRPTHVPQAPAVEPPAAVAIKLDGREVSVPAGSTILDACHAEGIDIPTMCWLENLTPVNVCRVCVVEVAGSRVLAPACSRKVEPGMDVQTESERVKASRKVVLEFLASSVDVSLAGPVAPTGDFAGYLERYGADPTRYGPSAAPARVGERDAHEPGHHHEPSGSEAAAAATVAQPVKVDNDLYVRDYSKCILCYKCVEACGEDAQNTFAIAVAGRGFDARISTEWNVGLPDSACVYCGNCIGVCPTGALMFKSEHDMRQAGTWDESAQTVTETICPYCGVGCAVDLHVQDNTIVKVTSPMDSSVTDGHLCIKGRFGFEFTQSRPVAPGAPGPGVAGAAATPPAIQRPARPSE
jgi:NADP-reducing hydrogenase subunit HndD